MGGALPRAVSRPLLGLLLVLAVVVPARIGFAPEAATASASTPGLPGHTTTVTLPVQHAGEHRSYVLHVPDGLLGPVPLVVALHGANQTAARMREYSQLERLAEEQGFALAFGMGHAGTWNAGACCRPKANDVAYLDAVLDHATDPLRSGLLVDRDRVFLTGFSNGGMMALRYACTRADRVAAVAVVAATVVSPCDPETPVAVLDVHGEVDRVVPLAGGRNSTFAVDFPAVRPALQPFRALSPEVRVRVVPGVGHAWMTYGAEGYDVSDAVWNWLRDHPRT
jgi:polyhydroxybutyrate depolymerase